MSSTELVTIPHSNAEIYRMSTDAAGLCAKIVLATAQPIQGKRYVKVEGWQAIAIAHGCIASSCDVGTVQGGIRATGEIRRMTDGFVIATAEGFVGDDETMWAKRPMYARRAMAQTRAISRACRTAFAHVVVMIDASLSTTPAEEVPDGGFGTYTHADAAQEAVNDGLASGTKSTYRTKAEGNAKTWADTAIETLNFASTVEDVDGWFADNQKALQRLEDNHPAQYDRVCLAADNARDRFKDRAA